MKRMTKEDLSVIKRLYHIGYDSGCNYTRHIYVERLVSEIEALWRERRREKQWRACKDACDLANEASRAR